MPAEKNNEEGCMRCKAFRVVWLKKADTTTFEYLMQLKVCSVLLAVDVC